jgi:UDP-glucose 4-epimerase
VDSIVGIARRLPEQRFPKVEWRWGPRFSSVEALTELLEGMRTSAGIETPPLSPGTSGPLRTRELLTGIGRREG